MFGVSRKSSVTLREERRPGDYRFLGVTRQKNGDLVFEGQDLGQGVHDALAAPSTSGVGPSRHRMWRRCARRSAIVAILLLYSRNISAATPRLVSGLS